MNVTRIALRNFRSWSELDFRLPDGATAIIGPNGAGKSSLLAAVDVGLFGPPGRSLEPFVRKGTQRLEVEIEFTHGGEAYRVRRGFAGGKSSLDFERADDEGDPFPTQKETQGRIGQVLGLTRATYRASAYLAQGDAAAVTSARPAERMEILRATLGGLDLFDRAHELARGRLAAVRRDEAELSGSIRTLDEALQQRPAVVAEYEQADDERDIVLTRVEAYARQAEAAAEEFRAVQQRIGEERAARGARMEAARRLHDAKLDSARAAWTAYETASEQRAEAIRRRQELEEQAAAALTRASELRETAQADEDAGPGEAHCRECGQLLGVEALAESVGFRREMANDHAARGHDLNQRSHAVVIPPQAPTPDPLPQWQPPVEEPLPDYGFQELRKKAVATASRV